MVILWTVTCQQITQSRWKWQISRGMQSSKTESGEIGNLSTDHE